MTDALADAVALPAQPGPASDLELVLDPAQGLDVSVRRDLAGAPVPEWRVLAVAAGQPPFAGPDWVRAVHHHLGTGEPLLVSVRRQGRLLAFGAFAVHAGPRPLVTLLGSGRSDYGAVLADPAAGVPTGRLVAAALDAVADAVPGALFDLEQVVEHDVLDEVVREWAQARGYALRRLPQATVHAVRLPATVEEHDRALGRHARHEERRQWRRLAEQGALTVVDDLLDGMHDLDPGAADARVEHLVAELAAVDAAHPRAVVRRQPWTGASGRTLAEVLRRTPRGIVQLSGLRLDGELVAYAFCLAGPTALHGYVQSYRARAAASGPGALLLLRIRRRALLAGYRELDLLRGEEAYKRRFERTTRRTVRLLLAPAGRDLLPGLADRLNLLRRTYRDELRRHQVLARRADAVAGRVADVRVDVARRAALVVAAADQRLPRRSFPHPFRRRTPR